MKRNLIKISVLISVLSLITQTIVVFSQDGYQEPVAPQVRRDTGSLYDSVLEQEREPVLEQTFPNRDYEQPPPTRGFDQGSVGFDAGTRRPLRGRVVVVPAGSTFEVSLSTTLSSGINKIGDTVLARVSSPVIVGSDVVVPAGSEVVGQVVNAIPAKRFRAGSGGVLEIRFTSLKTPNGEYPIVGSIDETTLRLQAETGGSRLAKGAAKTAVGAGIGALSGLVGAAISGGDKSKAAAIGSGIGGGIGALGALAGKGSELVLDSGIRIPVKLFQSFHAIVPPRD